MKTPHTSCWPPIWPAHYTRQTRRIPPPRPRHGRQYDRNIMHDKKLNTIMFSARNLFLTRKIQCDPILYPVASPFCPSGQAYQPCNLLKETYPNGCPKYYDCGCVVNGDCIQCPQDPNVDATLTVSGSFRQYTLPCNPGLAQWKEGSGSYSFQITTPDVTVINQTIQWYGHYKRTQIGDPRSLLFQCSYSEDGPGTSLPKKVNSPLITHNYLPCGGGLNDRNSLPFPEHYDRYFVEITLLYSKPGVGATEKIFISRSMPFSEMWEVAFNVQWVP